MIRVIAIAVFLAGGFVGLCTVAVRNPPLWQAFISFGIVALFAFAADTASRLSRSR